MKLNKILILMALMATLLVLGCSDRGVNYGKDTNDKQLGTYFTKEGAHVFHDELLFQIQNRFQQMPLVGYWPKAAFPINAGGEFKQVPMLILLPPQDGDVNFFFQHGLKELADELISSGEIQPMAILCVPNDQVFGGYFYAGNSPAAGSYDSLIGSELVRFAEEEFFVTTLRSKDKRAIGGFGMGAYGAYRAAMLNPNSFSTVSGVSGPMDFDGADGLSGFIPLFSEALNEQGIVGQDLVTNYNIQGNLHLSRLFVGAGYAFSAVDTLMYFVETVNQLNNRIDFSLDSTETLDSTIFPNSNVISFPGLSIPPNTFLNNSNFIFGFHLPFDNTGNIVTPVWDRWLENNLSTIFAANPNSLDGVNLWMANSSENTYGNFYEQTNSWISTLENNALTVEKYNYSGYDGHPANKDQYVYDILREMLIYHSEKFGN